MNETYADLGGQPPVVEDMGQEFLNALSTQARAGLHRTKASRALLDQAVTRGWATKTLAQECSRDLGSAENVGGIIHHRLLHCATHDPDVKKTAPVVAWCGQCEDTAHRFITDENHDPIQPCPRCHPSAGGINGRL